MVSDITKINHGPNKIPVNKVFKNCNIFFISSRAKTNIENEVKVGKLHLPQAPNTVHTWSSDGKIFSHTKDGRKVLVSNQNDLEKLD